MSNLAMMKIWASDICEWRSSTTAQQGRCWTQASVKPFWHCVGHAFELSLKSLLKKNGFDEMDLMQFINHDLYRAERSYLRQCPDSS